MELLHDDTYIQIHYDPISKIMICEWIGFQNREGIQKAGHIIIDLVRKKSVEKILNNNSKVTGPWNEATGWTNEVWFPAVIGAGLKYFAWILSPNPFAELSAKKAMPTTPVIKEFDNYDDAYTWLKSC